MRLLILFTAVVSPVVKADPSFDCAKAVQRVDRLLCSEAELAALDTELSNVFSAAVSPPTVTSVSLVPPDSREKLLTGLKHQILQDQRRWLRERDSSCGITHVDHDKSVECLRELYNLRIDWLKRTIAPYTGQRSADFPQALALERVVRLERMFPSASRFADAQLLSYRMTADGKDFQTVRVDPFVAEVRTSAALASQPQTLHAGAGYTISQHNNSELAISGGRTDSIFTVKLAAPAQAIRISGTELVVIERALDHQYDLDYPLSVERFDLNTRRRTGSRSGSIAGRPQFWNDRLVVMTSRGRIVLCTDNLEMVAQSEPFAGQPFDPRVVWFYQLTADHLIAQLPRGRLFVFELSSMRRDRDLVLPNSAFAYRGVIFRNFILVMPRQSTPFARSAADEMDQITQPNTVTVYDLSSGQRLTTWHLVGKDFAIQRDELAVYAETSSDEAVLSTYRLNESDLTRPHLLQAARNAAYRAARARLRSSSSVYEALQVMEEANTDSLKSAADADPETIAIAADYASWLAATIQGNSEGLRVLEELFHTHPHDPLLRRRLGAALLFNYLLTGSHSNANRSRELLGAEIFPAADIARWESVFLAPKSLPGVTEQGLLLSAQPKASAPLRIRGTTLTCVAAEMRQEYQPVNTCTVHSSQPGERRGPIVSRYLAAGIAARNVDQVQLAGLLFSSPLDDVPILALSKRWLIRDERPGEGMPPSESLADYRHLDATTQQWRETGVEQLDALGEAAWVSDELDTAVLHDQHTHFTRFIGLDLVNDVSGILMQTDALAYVRNWLVSGTVLLARQPDGWVIFDLKSRSLAGVLPLPVLASGGNRTPVALDEFVALGSRLFGRASELLVQ